MTADPFLGPRRTHNSTLIGSNRHAANTFSASETVGPTAVIPATTAAVSTFLSEFETQVTSWFFDDVDLGPSTVDLDRFGMADSSAALFDAGEEGNGTAGSHPVLSDTLIVLGEILNNIVEHAQVGQKRVSIAVEVGLGDGAIQIRTIDDGIPLPPGCLSISDHPDIGPVIDDLPEGGFGWLIIRQLTTDVAYDRISERNHLTVSVPLHRD